MTSELTLTESENSKPTLTESVNSEPTLTEGYEPWTDLDGERELWVCVVQDDDGLWHAHALPDADVVDERRLLDVYGHVDDRDVGVVELIENVRLAKVKLLERDVGQLHLEAERKRGE